MAAPAAPLPPLDAPCVKCGGDSLDLTWIPAADDALFERENSIPYDESREHMSAVCKNCGFVWPAAPKDAGP
jgi:hypothetical protein